MAKSRKNNKARQSRSTAKVHKPAVKVHDLESKQNPKGGFLGKLIKKATGAIKSLSPSKKK